MGLPLQAVTLTPVQVGELNQKLADMRHNVNNQLSLITAAAEIATRKPDMAQRFLGNLIVQPQRIVEEIRRFSDEFERAFGITRD
ncbi:MAG: hypothetical protein M1608_16295 [Candidatus Omnitrophica bacterium]|nr:hypothetical protein [Candidatus Omnitrophota bacterium]